MPRKIAVMEQIREIEWKERWIWVKMDCLLNPIPSLKIWKYVSSIIRWDNIVN